MAPAIRAAAFAAALSLAPAAASAEQALVAVAANYARAVQALAAEFTRDTGHSLQVTTGSTGKLYAQIAEGAPFDVLLSADARTPARIEDEGLGVPGSRFTYAIGRLSLYSADPDLIGTDPRAALEDPRTLFIAIANPDLAPYGLAAEQAMQAMGVWDNLQPKVVMGQNIGQTFALVDTGAAQVGFVATSALQGPGVEPKGSRHDIPQAMYAPIEQDAVLLIPGRDNPAARAFLDYLQGDRAKAIATGFGYGSE
ncbi:MAG: molybdate ABC transporter substrate-binding protein [Gemmobacter sp.]